MDFHDARALHADGGGGDSPVPVLVVQLSQAATDAAQAMRDADGADERLTAYGEAQTRLHDALTRAEAAQTALGTTSSGAVAEPDSVAHSNAVAVSSAEASGS